MEETKNSNFLSGHNFRPQMEGVKLKSALPSWKITVPSTAIFFDMALKLAATPAKATSYETNAAMHQ